MVETEMLKNFVYDQGEEACTTANQGRCDDTFSYIPYGSWVGSGKFQTTQIKIKPVVRQSSVLSEIAPNA